jgi:hypothetical protein
MKNETTDFSRIGLNLKRKISCAQAWNSGMKKAKYYINTMIKPVFPSTHKAQERTTDVCLLCVNCIHCSEENNDHKTLHITFSMNYGNYTKNAADYLMLFIKTQKDAIFCLVKVVSTVT